MTDYRLKQEHKKKDERKITFHIQRKVADKHGRESWRMTLWRLEWFPNKLDWRLIEAMHSNGRHGAGYWKRITHASFGDRLESEVVDLAIPTALLCGLDS